MVSLFFSYSAVKPTFQPWRLSPYIVSVGWHSLTSSPFHCNYGGQYQRLISQDLESQDFRIGYDPVDMSMKEFLEWIHCNGKANRHSNGWSLRLNKMREDKLRSSVHPSASGLWIPCDCCFTFLLLCLPHHDGLYPVPLRAQISPSYVALTVYFITADRRVTSNIFVLSLHLLLLNVSLFL